MSTRSPDTVVRCRPATLSPRRWQDDARFTACLRTSWEQQYADYLGTGEARRLVGELARSGALYRHHDPGTLIATVRGRPVGIAARRPLGELSLVTLLEVLPGWRGRGIGTQLLQALQGCPGHLMAHVSVHRPRVQALYLSSGFVALQRVTVDHHGHALPFEVLARAGKAARTALRAPWPPPSDARG